MIIYQLSFEVMRRILRILILTDNNDNADEKVVDPKQTAAMTQKFLLPPTPDDVLINGKWFSVTYAGKKHRHV